MKKGDKKINFLIYLSFAPAIILAVMFFPVLMAYAVDENLSEELSQQEKEEIKMKEEKVEKL